MDIKSVIRDYSLGNYVVNVLSLKKCKLSKCSIEISEDSRFHLVELPRSDVRHVNSEKTNFCFSLSFSLQFR